MEIGNNKAAYNKFIQPTPNSRFSFSFLRLWRGRLMIVVMQRKKKRHASVNEGVGRHAKRRKSLWRIGQKISRCMWPLL
jgi:hypothetical protein